MHTLLRQASGGAGSSSSSGSSTTPTGASHAPVAAIVAAQQERLALYCGLSWIIDEAWGHEASALERQEQGAMGAVLEEMAPGAVDRVVYWDKHAELVAKERFAEADRVRQQLKVLEKSDNAFPPIPEAVLRSRGRQAALGTNHDILAAFIDTAIVGRVYHRGSGERHIKRLATYPKFEGLSLQEFDQVDEGEISKLNRLVAQREESTMVKEFQQKILYNLGLVGEDLLELRGRAKPSKPTEGWSYVVYPLGGSKDDKPQPYVAQPDGTTRELNEMEAYFQKFKAPKRRRRFAYSGRKG